ncbi:hypothetical protein [Nocardioides lacusdianchii]|uniref:hypothetical protein n=1 Tax=Nocardioides lacusdianchii TaxID=2783664 RepID=UPI001CCCABDB|nr:hypothetical protein [Nocardioides lacusdianchii]
MSDGDLSEADGSGGRRLAVTRTTLALCLFVLGANAVVIQTVLTDGGPLKNVVRAGVLLLAVVGLAVSWQRLPWWPALWVLWAGLLLVVRGNQDQLSIIFVLALALLAAQVSERFFLGFAALSSIVAFALIFALLAVGLSTDDVVVTDYDGALRARHNFGAESIPFLFNVAFGACALAVLYAKKYLGRLQLAVAVAASLGAATYVYTQADTRGGYAAFLMFLVLLLVVPLVRIAWMYAAFPLVLSALTMWLAVADVSPRIDQVLSQRPDYFARFVDDVGVSDIVLSTSVKSFPYPVDSSYAHLLVGASVVALVLFLCLYWRAVTRLMGLRRHAEVAFLTAASAYCATEGLLVRIENGFIIVVWYFVLAYGAGTRSSSVGSSVAERFTFAPPTAPSTASPAGVE